MCQDTALPQPTWASAAQLLDAHLLAAHLLLALLSVAHLLGGAFKSCEKIMFSFLTSKLCENIEHIVDKKLHFKMQ